MRPFLTVVTVALTFSAALMAQEPPEPRVYVGGGIEAIGLGAAYERAYGLSLQAGYLRQYRRLALRLGATYFERTRYSDYGFARPRAVGGTLELAYDLTTSRFRPYVLGGWGLYRLSGTRRSQSGTYVVDQLSGAMLGGLGVRYRLAGADLFTEARLHGLTNGQGWGSVLMPVTLGLRF